MFETDKNGRLLPIYSIELELLKILSTQYNFTPHLIDGKNGWGWQENGTWLGVIGQLANRVSKVNLIFFVFFTKTLFRHQILHFVNCRTHWNAKK